MLLLLLAKTLVRVLQIPGCTTLSQKYLSGPRYLVLPVNISKLRRNTGCNSNV